MSKCECAQDDSAAYREVILGAGSGNRRRGQNKCGIQMKKNGEAISDGRNNMEPRNHKNV